jgi:hypothetical protein
MEDWMEGNFTAFRESLFTPRQDFIQLKHFGPAQGIWRLFNGQSRLMRPKTAKIDVKCQAGLGIKRE